MNPGISQTRNNSYKAFKNVKYLLLLVILFSSRAFAQPANDDPCNAIVLTATATCTYTTYTNAAATGSTGVPAPLMKGSIQGILLRIRHRRE